MFVSQVDLAAAAGKVKRMAKRTAPPPSPPPPCLCDPTVSLAEVCATLPRDDHLVDVGGGAPLPVTRYRWVGEDRWDLSGACTEQLALQQREIAEDQLLVALAGADGLLHTLLRTPTTEPAELALAACLMGAGEEGVTVAIAFHAEPRTFPLDPGTYPVNLEPMAERLRTALAVAAWCGVHLVEWAECGSYPVRFLGVDTGVLPSWWDLPGGPLEGLTGRGDHDGDVHEREHAGYPQWWGPEGPSWRTPDDDWWDPPHWPDPCWDWRSCANEPLDAGGADDPWDRPSCTNEPWDPLDGPDLPRYPPYRPWDRSHRTWHEPWDTIWLNEEDPWSAGGDVGDEAAEEPGEPAEWRDERAQGCARPAPRQPRNRQPKKRQAKKRRR